MSQICRDHAVSYDSVSRAETAITSAKLQVTNNPIPPGFKEKHSLVLMFDNIDFCEETKSGSGTSHHVNGIMFQSQDTTSPDNIVSYAASTPVSKRSRTIHNPPNVLPSYYLGKLSFSTMSSEAVFSLSNASVR